MQERTLPILLLFLPPSCPKILLFLLFFLPPSCPTCFQCSELSQPPIPCPTSISDSTGKLGTQDQNVPEICSIVTSDSGKIYHQGVLSSRLCNNGEYKNHMSKLIGSATVTCCSRPGCNWNLDSAKRNVAWNGFSEDLSTSSVVLGGSNLPWVVLVCILLALSLLIIVIFLRSRQTDLEKQRLYTRSKSPEDLQNMQRRHPMDKIGRPEDLRAAGLSRGTSLIRSRDLRNGNWEDQGVTEKRIYSQGARRYSMSSGDKKDDGRYERRDSRRDNDRMDDGRKNASWEHERYDKRVNEGNVRDDDRRGHSLDRNSGRRRDRKGDGTDRSRYSSFERGGGRDLSSHARAHEKWHNEDGSKSQMSTRTKDSQEIKGKDRPEWVKYVGAKPKEAEDGKEIAWEEHRGGKYFKKSSRGKEMPLDQSQFKDQEEPLDQSLIIDLEDGKTH